MIASFRFLVLAGLWVGCVVALGGCRDRDDAPPMTASGPASRAVPPAADKAVPAPAAPALPDRQVKAVDRIVAAGGSVERSVDGQVIGVDLISDRVVADDALVRAAQEFPHLRRLRLAVSKISPQTLEGLSSLSDLDELLLQDAAIDDATLATVLHGMPLLRRLTLRRASRVSDAGLAALKECPALEVVALIELNGVTGAVVDALRSVERLRSLDVRNCGQLTTADFAQLVSLVNVSELKVGGPAVNDEVLNILGRHPALTSLSVDDAQVSPACLQQLAAMPELTQRLRSLSFARCSGVTDESLHVLNSFPVLETLALREIMLTGSFLQNVHDSADKPLPLKTLIITNAFVSDESLTPLPGVCPSLTRLDLTGNRGVTNAVLGILKQIRPLREVHLDDTGVTEKWFPQVE
jgi:hypothetical protein